MYDTILVPTDGSEGAAVAEEPAIDLAERYGASVHGLYVAEALGTPLSSDLPPSEFEDEFLEGAHPADSLRERALERDVPATVATRVGRPDEEVCDYAEEIGAELIVMGTHGRSGLDRILLGSTTERTLRTAGVPILVVPRPD